MPGDGSKFNGQELKDRKMGNFHVLGLEMSKNDLWSAKFAALFSSQKSRKGDCLTE